jgi:hypothetical protein
MDQEDVKEKLRAVYESFVDYTVIFSGKKSDKVNGLYKPGTKEIIIHNKNFVDGEGRQNENLPLYTAIHELAHHVMFAEKGRKNSRAHSQEFWATFYNLLDAAEEKGIYRAEIDGGTQKLIEEARAISLKIAELQRELGRVIIAIGESCQKNGLRTEDVIERKAQIGKQSAAIAVKAYNIGDQGVGIDVQTEAARQRDEGKRGAVIQAARNGKSVVQAKRSVEESKPEEDETKTLEREKRRIETTIESLNRRLDEIKDRLNLIVCRLDKSA